jgi:hypothetical protein
MQGQAFTEESGASRAREKKSGRPDLEDAANLGVKSRPGQHHGHEAIRLLMRRPCPRGHAMPNPPESGHGTASARVSSLVLIPSMRRRVKLLCRSSHFAFPGSFCRSPSHTARWRCDSRTEFAPYLLSWQSVASRRASLSATPPQDPGSWRCDSATCDLPWTQRTAPADDSWVTGLASIPRPEMVADWRAKYVGVWEVQVSGLAPSAQQKRARRVVLPRSSDWFERLARKVLK